MSKTSTANRRAVSPIVAVLILIVVAVVGGGAIAVLMGQISSQTAQQASTQATKNNAATTISIGGSTTVFPITEAIKQNFTSTTGILINDAQGGSGAGMVGVSTGVLDVGASSSLSTFTNAQNKFTSSNLQDFVFAGSGVVIVVQDSKHFLTPDGTVHCNTISEAALKAIFNNGITKFGLKACTNNVITSAASDIDLTAAIGRVYNVYQRSDLPSGTADTFSSYINGKAEGSTPLTGATGEVGNPGVFSAVNNDATGQAIGYVDIAFDKDASNNAVLNIPSITSADSNAAANPNANMPEIAVGAAIKGSQTEKSILNSLAGTGSFPDSGAGNNQLARYLLYATAGAPSADVQKYFDFIGSVVARVQINNLGYYTPFDWKGQGL